MSKEKINIRYLRDERNRGSVMKVLNDFLVDIMGAIIPGFLFIFSFGIALGVPIILIYDISIPKSFYNSIVSFGSIILILLLSYVIGHGFYRADIYKPDKNSIAHKMKSHIKEVFKECKEDVKKQSEEPIGFSDVIPKEISYRMKQMLLNSKYIDSSRDKSLEYYVSLFYSELLSDKDDDNNTDNVFNIIKNHFDGINSFDNHAVQCDESKDIATRSDYFNLIDILSDCIEYVVNTYLSHMEYLITHISQIKEQRSIVTYLKVFFKEIKFIDYCDNYCEYQYLLRLIHQLKKISFSSHQIGDSQEVIAQAINETKEENKEENKEEKEKNEIETFLQGLVDFSQKLNEYKINILEASGVKDSFLNDYKKIIQRIGKMNDITIEQDSDKDNPVESVEIRIKKLEYDLLLFTSIRRMQNEEGTPHKNAGGFPYINYENYLFKRNLHHLAEMVNWNYREGRTKNQINRYKIKIQLFCPDAYGVLNKNESHVRMASSSWFASNFLVWTNIVITLLLFGIQYPLWKDGLNSFASTVQVIIPLLPPMTVSVLLYLLKRKIEDFIHYQRLREIYFALYTYHECKNEIRYKEEYYAHCPFPDKDIVEYENESVKQQ